MVDNVAPVGSNEAHTSSTTRTSWSTAHGNPKMASAASGTFRSVRPIMASGSPAIIPWMTPKKMNRTISSVDSSATWW